MHDNSMRMMTDFRDRYLQGMQGCTVLDVGSQCYHKQQTYRELFVDYQYTGMDVVSGPNVDVVGFEFLPLEKYDVVISGQVMEHVKYPWEWLQDLCKLFVKYICIIAPNVIHEHRYPIDCYRFYPDGMLALFEYADIRALEVRRDGNDTIGIGGHK